MNYASEPGVNIVVQFFLTPGSNAQFICLSTGARSGEVLGESNKCFGPFWKGSTGRDLDLNNWNTIIEFLGIENHTLTRKYINNP